MNRLLELIPLSKYFVAGGSLMYPLLLCSIIGVAVIVERLIRLSRSRLIDPDVVEDIQTQIERGQIEDAIARNRRGPTLVARILSRGLEEFLHTSADIETSLVESGERGLSVLHNNMSVLNLISRVAPLLGLLGTVTGMIAGFDALSEAGVGKEKLAEAMSVALITTATGLIVAIPTIIAAAYFRSRIRRLQAEFEEIFIDVIKTVKTSPVVKVGAAPQAREDAPAPAEAAEARL